MKKRFHNSLKTFKNSRFYGFINIFKIVVLQLVGIYMICRIIMYGANQSIFSNRIANLIIFVSILNYVKTLMLKEIGEAPDYIN